MQPFSIEYWKDNAIILCLEHLKDWCPPYLHPCKKCDGFGKTKEYD